MSNPSPKGVLEIVLTFESAERFTESEIASFARRAAEMADDAAEDLGHEVAEIVYGVEVKEVRRFVKE